MTSSAPDSTSGRSPAFQFYPADFLSDRNVVVMSMQERGVYITLICYAWAAPLPSNLEQLSRLCGMPLAAFRKLWPALSVCFRTQPDGTLVHPRLERERRKQEDYRQKQAERGRASGAARRKPHEPETNTGSSMVEPELNAGSPVVQPVVELLSSTPTPTPSSTHLISSRTSVGNADGRSRRPIFRGQRFVVFDWMLEDLWRMLGPNADTFHLDEWFFTLDARAVAENTLVPQRDGGRWLQEQTLNEAKRRGLISEPEHKSKLTQALEKASNGW